MLLAGVISRSAVSAEPFLILRICSVDRRSLFLSVVFRALCALSPFPIFCLSTAICTHMPVLWLLRKWLCFLFIKIILFIYVFVFDSAGSSLLWRLFSNCGNWCLLSSCGAWTSHCRGFSCCRARGFRACGLQYLRHMGSVIEAPGL